MSCCEKSAPVNLAYENHRLNKEPNNSDERFESFYKFVCWNCEAFCSCEL